MGLTAATLLLALVAMTQRGPSAQAQEAVAADPCLNPGGGVKTFVAGPPLKVCTVPAGASLLKAEAWGAQVVRVAMRPGRSR